MPFTSGIRNALWFRHTTALYLAPMRQRLTRIGSGDTQNFRGWRIIGLSLLLLLALSACQKSEFAPDAKFVDLYVELKLATVGYANDLDKVNEVRRVILAQHQESPAAFHDQYVQLMAHPEAWRKFQIDVIKQVETFQSTHRNDKVDTVGKVDKTLKDGKTEKGKKER